MFEVNIDEMRHINCKIQKKDFKHNKRNYLPKIPAKVVLKSFIVSSPSGNSSSSFKNGFCFCPPPFLLLVEDALELSETVLDSESVTLKLQTQFKSQYSP